MQPLQRIVIFLVSLFALSAIFYFLRNGLPPNESISVIIFSSLVLLSFSTLFLEHWFTKPTDVLASSISILLVLAPSRGNLSAVGNWYDVFVVYLLIIVIISLAALATFNSEASSASKSNRFSKLCTKISSKFGRARFLYFALFLLTVVFYVDSQKPIFLALLIYSGLVISIDPKSLLKLFSREKKKNDSEIGEIIGVQSRHTYLARLLENRPPVKRYDFVEFLDGADKGGSRKGIVIDNWVLNAQQWIKVVSGSDINSSLGNDQVGHSLKKNIIYKIETTDTADILNRLVGTIRDKSTILSANFDYAMKVSVTEGTLVEIPIKTKTVMYQIIEGTTETEVLENKNEAGFIVGQAVQIGTWNAENLTFERYGWVPEINSPVYLASDIQPVEPPAGEMLLGHIPDTNFPVFMNKFEAVNCHMAVLGVTGTGKSVFTRNLVRTLSGDHMKNICIDFTGEYRQKFGPEEAVSMVSPVESEALFRTVDALSAEMAKFENNWRPDMIAGWERELRQGFTQSIRRFLDGEQNIGIFELPDVANSTNILSYTRWFFKVLFEMAKAQDNFPNQVCVVLEEAHTVIPEWNFAGSEGKGSQSLLNQIGQIALQGRKYGVGFLVIAQRTASVSKTVLTQCNTIIAFQQFDKTSGDFLANYMGSNMISALQNLKPRHAIAVGKAFRSGLPIIFRVPDIEEP